MKLKCNYVFVVLVYRNADDLNDFINSINHFFSYSRIIVVNAFYDEESAGLIKRIACENGCDYISIDNKGYSYGNNKGIEFANTKYDYEFLIVSNPDIIVKKNNFDFSVYYRSVIVIAPEITTLTGKKQNPYWAQKNNFSEKLVYWGYKYKCNFIAYIGIGINKIIREFFLRGSDINRKKIYAAHGCFIVFSRKTIELLEPLFDENMFLFAEESMLAHKLECMNIPVIYTTDLSVEHKEDGSLRISKLDTSSITRGSVMYYYEKYVKKG